MNGRVPIVLLIEHDALQRGTLARILKTAGNCVIPVGRAHEALETFAMHHIDIALVVADTQTQSLSGPPLLDALCSIDPHVPVIALSGGVAVDRPAYEYPNVAATLVEPFEPEDVLALTERVLRADAFNWPPTEEDLADIHVVDTTAWQTVSLPGPRASERKSHALVKPPIAAPVLLKPSSAPLVEVARDELVRPPRLVIRGLERRPFVYDFKMSPRTRRAMSVAATAICGLALTTLLELRGVPTRPDPLLDETREVASTPLLLPARDHRLDATPMISARRVTPRATADIIGRAAVQGPIDAAANAPARPARVETAPALTAALAPSRRADAPRDTRTVAARATPSASVAPAAPPMAASSEATTREAQTMTREAQTRTAPALDAAPRPDAPVREAVMAANVPAPAPVAAPAAPAAAAGRIREEERGIYDVLQQYQRAYEQLDVNAARAIWPSLNARALARAFEGLKAQALEFSHCRVAMEPAEATAICGGSASYVPRVGRQATRTEPRQWTFHLRKTDRDWLIAKAEVR